MTVRDILNHHDSRIIIFLQFEPLAHKIIESLGGLGHPVYLHGSAHTRIKTLESWKAGLSKVLVLSFDETAAGANLIETTDLIFLHPAFTNNKYDAAKMEHQALGRALRPGQQKRVHVKRFIVLNTIEEELTRKNIISLKALAFYDEQNFSTNAFPFMSDEVVTV